MLQLARSGNNNKGLNLKEILLLRTGSRIGDAITDATRAKNFVRELNAVLKGAGIKKVSEKDSIKELMSLMLTIGALDKRRREDRLLEAFPAGSNQLLAYAPKDSTFEEANKADGGKYHVYTAGNEKYMLELPPTLVDRYGNALTNEKGEVLTPKNARNYAISITLDNIKELGFDIGRNGHVISVSDISKWFAMALPGNDTWFNMVLGKDGVLEGFAIGDRNYFVRADGTNWLGLLARGDDGRFFYCRSVGALHVPFVRLGVLINTENAKIEIVVPGDVKSVLGRAYAELASLHEDNKIKNTMEALAWIHKALA